MSEPRTTRCVLYQDVLVPENRWEKLKQWVAANGWFIVDEDERGYILALSPVGILVRFYKVSKNKG